MRGGAESYSVTIEISRGEIKMSYIAQVTIENSAVKFFLSPPQDE